MAMLVAQWLVAVAVALCHVVSGCNVREVAEIIQNRFRQEVASNCKQLGEKCTLEWDCCKGLKCDMSAFMGVGVDTYCHKNEVENKDVEMGPTDQRNGLTDEEPNEPSSDEDVAWMRARSEDEEETGTGVRKKSDTLSEISELQEKKKAELQKENEVLEKLFTEKEEKELKQLRILKEDAEADELRRLKELRLKRKLQLIKELKELRALKVEEDLDTIDGLKNKTKKVVTENKEDTTKKETTIIEETVKDAQKEEGLTEHRPNHVEHVNNTQTNTDTQKHLHKRKHHRKHKSKQHSADTTQLNATQQNQVLGTENNETKPTEENATANTTENIA